jgi:tetratricopeptide (TPR) repeat protein
VYLPFLGLILIVLEPLRRLQFPQAVGTCAAAILACTVLTYQRSDVWSTPIALWQDTVAKSPAKMRPRFHLAFAQYQAGVASGNIAECSTAASNFEAASHLDVPDYRLLVDWANALDCAGREDEAATVFERAIAAFPSSAEAYVGLSAVYGKQKKFDKALKVLDDAEKIDPSIAQIYVNRGGVYEMLGNYVDAAKQYQLALELDSANRSAREGLRRVVR